MQVMNNVFIPYAQKTPVVMSQRLKTQAFDSVSFCGGLKKADLTGFNYICNELFKFPLEKMASLEDFNAMARNETVKCLSAEYPSKRDHTGIIKEARAKELEVWKEFLIQESPSCVENPSIALVIAKGLTRNLKPSNEALPTVLNKEVLEDTVKELKERLLADKKASFNFMDRYSSNLKAHYLEKVRQEDFADSDGDGFWIKITSEPEINIGGQKPGESDDERYERFEKKFEQVFQENVKKLRVLSHQNWCTSSYMAEKYLGQGDFHIFIENGEPKFAIRFEDEKIAEIEEPQNNRVIQKDSTGILNRYIAKNGYKYQYSSNVDADFVRLGGLLNEHVKNKDYFKILECLGFEPKLLESGKFSINGYNKASYDNNLKDFGVDENEMFENIEIINGDVDLSYTELESLGSVKKIKGDLKCHDSKLSDLGALRIIGGSGYLEGSKVERLKYLTKVGKDLNLSNSDVRRLDYLIEVGGDLHLEGSAFEKTGKPKVKQKDGSVKTLPKFENLERVGGHIFLSEYAYTEEMEKDIWKRNGLNLPKLV